jgi:apolipoprotein N-acyltransferase
LKKYIEPVIAGCAGALLACAAWIPGADGHIALVWLLPIFWALCSSRLSAASCVGCYFFVVSRDIPLAIAQFTGVHLGYAMVPVIGHTLAMAGLWGAAWTRKLIPRVFRLGLVLLLTNIPPIAAIGFASPLLSSGWLYPGMGWMGLVLTFLTWSFAFVWIAAIRSWWVYRAQCMRRRSIGHWVARWPIAVAFALPFLSGMLLVAASILNAAPAPPAPPKSWHGVQTHFGRYPSALVDQYARHNALITIVRPALNGAANVVVLPEEVGGVWQARIAWLWQGLTQSLPHKKLIVGFDVLDSAALFSNRALMLQDGRVVASVAARIPVPIGSWRPWAPMHAPMRWFENGLLYVDQTSVAVIFCYEELLLWPWFISALHMQSAQSNPPVALVMVNHWFASNTSINDAQMRSSESWARLFGLSVLRVVNTL